MAWWKKKEHLGESEEKAVVQAITAAEQGNRGEVKVHLEARCRAQQPMERAADLFGELGMQETRDGTGVLLYVAVEDRKAAVYAGPGIHGAAEAGFWQGVVDAVAEGFKAGSPEKGLVDALGRIGDLLRATVPGEDDAGNELADEVSTS